MYKFVRVSARGAEQFFDDVKSAWKVSGRRIGCSLSGTGFDFRSCAMNLELLAHGLEDYCHISSVLSVAKDKTVRLIESVLHELSHATVLGIRFRRKTKGRETWSVEGEVERWFNNRSNRPLLRIMSECRALAVEKQVIEDLGLDIDWQKVCKEAAIPMGRQMNQASVMFVVVRLRQERPSTVRRRADKVLRAVRRVARKVGA